MDFNLTLIGQSIAMLLFVWFCMKYVWPLIMGAIEQRQTEIANGLAAAEKGQSSLTTAKVEVDKIIAAARDQARGIVDQANTRATGIVEQAKADGEAARKAQVEAGRAEIGVEINRAREELRGQVAKIAVAGAEKVLGREIDANAHRDLLGKLASRALTMADSSTVARPYAKALFDLRERRAEAAGVVGGARRSGRGRRPTRTPSARSRIRRSTTAREPTLVGSVAGAINGGGAARERRRARTCCSCSPRTIGLTALPEIAAQFDALKAEAENKVKVTVTSATAVDGALAEQIKKALEQKLGRTVELTLAVDASLIGGAIIQADDMVIDGSVRTRLQRLTETARRLRLKDDTWQSKLPRLAS